MMSVHELLLIISRRNAGRFCVMIGLIERR